MGYILSKLFIINIIQLFVCLQCCVCVYMYACIDECVCVCVNEHLHSAVGFRTVHKHKMCAFRFVSVIVPFSVCVCVLKHADM